jgi:hypothetical protein
MAGCSSPGLVKWDLWWIKWRWGRFSPSTSVSLANLHFTNFSIMIITRGWYNRPFSGRRAEWTHLGLQPPHANLKKKHVQSQDLSDKCRHLASNQAIKKILFPWGDYKHKLLTLMKSRTIRYIKI